MPMSIAFWPRGQKVGEHKTARVHTGLMTRQAYSAGPRGHAVGSRDPVSFERPSLPIVWLGCGLFVAFSSLAVLWCVFPALYALEKVFSRRHSKIYSLRRSVQIQIHVSYKSTYLYTRSCLHRGTLSPKNGRMLRSGVGSLTENAIK